MDASVRYIQAFLLLSVGITLAKLTTDRGGGDYFFTLVWLVLIGAAAPYVLAMAVMRRLRRTWALAVGSATTIFGVVDVAVRMQAFFFPTDRSGGGMALWLPIYSLAMIPLLSAICYTAISALRASIMQD